MKNHKIKFTLFFQEANWKFRLKKNNQKKKKKSLTTYITFRKRKDK